MTTAYEHPNAFGRVGTESEVQRFAQRITAIEHSEIAPQDLPAKLATKSSHADHFITASGGFAILSQPGGVLRFADFARDQQRDDLNNINLRSCQLQFIACQKDIPSHKPRAFVAVDEQMIANNSRCVRRGQVVDIRITISEKMLRSCQCRIEQRWVSNSQGSTMFGKQSPVHRQHDGLSQPDRVHYLANSRKAFLYFFMPSSANSIWRSNSGSNGVIR